jgi:hypothetical protein
MNGERFQSIIALGVPVLSRLKSSMPLPCSACRRLPCVAVSHQGEFYCEVCARARWRKARAQG